MQNHSTNYPPFGTKVAQNPKYGRPSAKKLRQRLAAMKAHVEEWKDVGPEWVTEANARAWKLHEQIHAEVDRPNSVEDISCGTVPIDQTSHSIEASIPAEAAVVEA